MFGYRECTRRLPCSGGSICILGGPGCTAADERANGPRV